MARSRGSTNISIRRTLPNSASSRTRDDGEPSHRHCERSEAIQSGLRHSGLPRRFAPRNDEARSEEHTSELQSLMRISYAVFCLQKKTQSEIPTRYAA